MHDVLGLYDKLQPKFSRQYVDVGSAISSALERYAADVRTASFPAKKESFTIADEQYDGFIGGQIAQERASNAATEAAATREAQIAALHANLLELEAEVARKRAEADLASLAQQVAKLQADLLLAVHAADSDHGSSQGGHRTDPRLEARLLEVTA